LTLYIAREEDPAQIALRLKDELTPDLYVGDRAVRESGFDRSARFGPFSTDIINCNSMDINSLLYQMERDMEEILTLLGCTAEGGCGL
jgi:alpha,alpha-trehalase